MPFIVKLTLKIQAITAKVVVAAIHAMVATTIATIISYRYMVAYCATFK